MSRVAKLATSPSRILPPKDGLFKLRLAGADQAREDGFIGIDNRKTESVDYVIDLKAMPWPIDDAAVDAAFAAFYFQRLTNPERHAFMNETWRVIKPGGQLIMAMPHWSSERALADPDAQWPPLAASAFMRYNKEWREREKVGAGLICDWDFGYGYGLDPDVQLRNEHFQHDAIKHKVNAALDLHVTLTRRA